MVHGSRHRILNTFEPFYCRALGDSQIRHFTPSFGTPRSFSKIAWTVVSSHAYQQFSAPLSKTHPLVTTDLLQSSQENPYSTITHSHNKLSTKNIKKKTNTRTSTMATQPQPQPQAASPPASLTIRDPDLGHALSALRATPAAELSAVRILRIVLTEASLWHWQGSLWPEATRTALEDEDVEDYARLYPPAASSDGGPPPREAFRALLRFVAESETFDLARLDLEVDAGSAAYSLFEDKAAGAYGGDEVDEEWRFVYEYYLDVGRALAEVFSGGAGAELRAVRVETTIWEGMGAWLEGQVSGRGTVVAKGLPRYHDPEMRLLPGRGGDAAADGSKAD